jgi:hypothetical protein
MSQLPSRICKLVRVYKMAASLQKVGASTKWPESTAGRRTYKLVRGYKLWPVYKPDSRPQTRLPIRRLQKRFPSTNPVCVSFGLCLQKRLLSTNRFCMEKRSCRFVAQGVTYKRPRKLVALCRKRGRTHSALQKYRPQPTRRASHRRSTGHVPAPRPLRPVRQ